MIEFAFAIAVLLALFWFRKPIKTGAQALEDTSHSYLEDVLLDNAFDRQERHQEIEEYMKKHGIESFVSHQEILQKLSYKE